MIPKAYITHWRQIAPWIQDAQVEQDLIISRALVEMFNHPKIARALAFRGGTALYKLHMEPARYSEDIDLVQVDSEPIGETLDAIHEVLDSWLGEPTWKKADSRFTLKYKVRSEGPPAVPIRLKIEINTREHFAVHDFEEMPFEVDSPWFAGVTTIQTYCLNELLGTKLRALYQRRKGRDLFDLWWALEHDDAGPDEIVDCFAVLGGSEPVGRGRSRLVAREVRPNLFGSAE